MLGAVAGPSQRLLLDSMHEQIVFALWRAGTKRARDAGRVHPALCSQGGPQRLQQQSSLRRALQEDMVLQHQHHVQRPETTRDESVLEKK